MGEMTIEEALEILKDKHVFTKECMYTDYIQRYALGIVVEYIENAIQEDSGIENEHN